MKKRMFCAVFLLSLAILCGCTTPDDTGKDGMPNQESLQEEIPIPETEGPVSEENSTVQMPETETVDAEADVIPEEPVAPDPVQTVEEQISPSQPEAEQTEEKSGEMTEPSSEKIKENSSENVSEKNDGSVLPETVSSDPPQSGTSEKEIKPDEENKTDAEVKESDKEPEPSVQEEKKEPERPAAPAIVEASSVNLSETSLTLTEGETKKITATISPDNAADKTVMWSSSDSSIVSVENGILTAKSAGAAKITASTANGKTAELSVTVKAKIIEAESITLSETSLTLTEGETKKITATVTPENATDKSVKWSTSDAKVVSVENGTLTAKAAGSAKITASTANGKTAELSVTVNAKTVEAESIALSETSLTLTEGETKKITATVTPDNATDKSVKWSTSDAKVVSVENGTVTAKAAGSAKITVSTANGKTAELSVTVNAKIVASMGDSAEYYYYSLLDADKKAIYDALCSAMSSFSPNVPDFDKFGCPVDTVTEIIDYIRLDHVEFFHLADQIGYSFYTEDAVVNVNLDYIMDGVSYASAMNELNVFCENFRKEASKLATEAERVLLAYDTVKKLLVYDQTFAPESHNMYYAYINRTGVCEAYAKLFGFLLNKIGIESVQVNGFCRQEHRWVMAKVDGDWYHFDPTWDDPIGGSENMLYYDYFAVNDTAINKDHMAYSPELLPKAAATAANYFVANGLVLDSLSEDAIKKIAEKSYALTGRILFSCAADVFTGFMASPSDYLWTFVHAAEPSATNLSWTNNEISRVIQIIIE